MSYKCWNCGEGDPLGLPETYPEFPEKCPNCGQDGEWFTIYTRMHPLTYDEIEFDDGRRVVFKEKLEFSYEIYTTVEHLENIGKALKEHDMMKTPGEMSWEEHEEMHRVLAAVEPKDIHIAENWDINFCVHENSMEMLCSAVPACFEALWLSYVDTEPEELTIDAREYARKLKSLVREIIPPEE